MLFTLEALTLREIAEMQNAAKQFCELKFLFAPMLVKTI